MRFSTQRAALLSASTILATSMAGPVLAQTVGEIVVTAQRREETLQSVPISITAVTSEALAKTGIKNFDDLNVLTPGVYFSRVTNSTVPFIRGAGSAQVSGGLESTNSIYLDGVYLLHVPSIFFNFNNIARIEVLRGPQGTLFGRNSTGGLVQIVTKDPSHEPHLQVSSTYENYDRISGNLYATAGLTDWAAADVALYYTNQGKGWGRNLLTGKSVDKDRQFGARSKWLFDVSDDVRLTLSADYATVNSTHGQYRVPAPGTTFGGTQLAFPGDYRTYRNDIDGFTAVEQKGISANLNADLGFSRLISITAYRESDAHQLLDQDSGPTNRITPNIRDSLQQFSQEVQLVSPDGSPFDWIAGVYFLRAHDQLHPFGVRGLSQSDVYARNNLRSFAQFAQATLPIGERAHITGGLRYTQDKRVYSAISQAIPSGVVSQRTATLVNNPTFKKLTYRLAADYQLTPDVLTYVSYNRGFKSGNFNASSLNAPYFNPEVVDAWEVGFKSELLERSLRLNGSVFYYNYKDLQTQTVPAPGVTLLINAASAHIKGGELEATYRATENLTLTSGLSVIDAEFSKFPLAPFFTPNPAGGFLAVTCIPAAVCDATGKKLTRTPNWTLDIGVDYQIPTSFGDFNLNATYYHNAGFYWDVQNTQKEQAYDLVNAQASFTTLDERYRFRVFGNNVFNKTYAGIRSMSTSGDILAPAAPRTYGVGLEAKF